MKFSASVLHPATGVVDMNRFKKVPLPLCRFAYS
jgi:hypothetical protein